METILSSVIAATVTIYFVRRHMKALSAGKGGTRAARQKLAGREAGTPNAPREAAPPVCLN